MSLIQRWVGIFTAACLLHLADHVAQDDAGGPFFDERREVYKPRSAYVEALTGLMVVWVLVELAADLLRAWAE